MSSCGALVLAACMALCSAQTAVAQKRYDPGASDTEIKIGQTMPYSGPASAYGTQGRAQLAYYKMVNAQGGINGRKVNLLSVDDGYSPPKTVEAVRKLVEEEQVLALVNPLGTAPNIAVHKYMNLKKVPHLLVSSGAARWNDPKNFPWTTPGFPPYVQEGKVYGKHLLKNFPNAKIAVLSQNDDSGRDYVGGFKQGLGAATSKIVKELTYEISDPTVDSQVIELKGSGADVLFLHVTPKAAAQAIRKVAALGWKPQVYLVSVASSPAQVLVPAGMENCVGFITASTLKMPDDPAWENDPGMKAYLKFMKDWMPEGNPLDLGNLQGYFIGMLSTRIFKAAGDELTRENVLRQATTLSKLSLPVMLPGITLNLSPTDYATWTTFQPLRFDGKRWVLFGDPTTADAP
jgi:branched-chain amino acid transport system substrate-binding protein